MIQTVSDKVLDGLIVDRSKFHSALENEITSYKEKLKNDDLNTRKNFIEKMNLICGIKAQQGVGD